MSIRNDIVQLCQKKLKIAINSIEPEYDNYPITNYPLHFDAVDILYVILEIQYYYNIVFDEEQLKDFGLFTIGKIIAAVEEKCTERTFQVS